MTIRSHQFLSVFIAFLAVLIGACDGRRTAKETLSHISDEPASTTQSDPNTPSMSIEAKSGGNLAGILDPIYWYKGDLRPEYPKCGNPIDPKCQPPIEPSDEKICSQIVQQNQRENFLNGFYLAKRSEYDFCNDRCKPSNPSCSGLKCIGSALSYAGKKVLDWTDACQQACMRAVSRNILFPYECRNLNDDFNRKELIEEIRKAEAKALRDPKIKAQLQELEAIRAQNADTERRIVAGVLHTRSA
jgi:hypothetical protein